MGYKMLKIRSSFAKTIGMTVITTVTNAPLSQAQEFDVAVKPSTVEMIIKPGDLQRQKLTFKNPYPSKTITLDLSLSDWTLDDDGALILDVPEHKTRSALDWVSISQSAIILEPEASKDITVQITPPYDIQTKGDHRFALLATTLLPELDEHGTVTSVWNRYQLTSLFYLTLTPSESLPKVTSVVLNAENPSLISLEVENKGDAHARLRGAAYIKDAKGNIASETPLNVVVLDNGKRTYNFQLKDTEDLASGEYIINFDLDNMFTPQSKLGKIEVPIESLPYIVE